MRLPSLLAFLLLATACAAPARPAKEPAGADLAVRCGRLIDGISDAPRAGVTVLIRGGRVAEVAEKVRVPPGTPALDLSGYTVLPGLIDLHVHLMDSPADFGDPKVYLKRTEEESLREGRAHAAATLRAGFTTVRNLGTYLPWADRALRDDIASGRTPGPRMQIAGYYLTIPGGGGDVRPPGVPEGDIPAILRRGVARGPEAFRRKAEEALAQGADLLKVIASGAVLAFGSEPGAPEMTKDEIAAVVAAAHAAGKKVAAHAHGARSVRDALEAGADTIEHASLIDAAGLALAKARGVPLSMDVYNGDYIDEDGRKAGWPAEYLEKNRATTQTQRDAFREALRLGVPIVFGTDAGVYPHGLNARQFKIMTALGMSPMEAIRSATALAARCMGWEDRVGAVAPGRYGDLVAVRGDPLADIALLEDVRVVVQGGRVARAD